MIKRFAVLILLLIAVRTEAKPIVLISGSSKCKLSPATLTQLVYQAGFSDGRTVVITCLDSDWKNWTDNPDQKIFTKSKNQTVFVRGEFLETDEGVEALQKEAHRGTK